MLLGQGRRGQRWLPATHGDRAQAARMPRCLQSVGQQRGRQTSTEMGAAEKEWGWCKGGLWGTWVGLSSAMSWVQLGEATGTFWRRPSDQPFVPRAGLGSDFVWVSFTPRAVTWLGVPTLLPATEPRSLPGSLLESWAP